MDYTSEELKDLKYAIVTAKLKDSKNLETEGFFVGIRPIVDKDFEVAKASDLYVWIYRKGSVHMFHLDYYYVDKINVGYGDKSIISSTRSYKDDQVDQKLAIERLKAIHKGFIAGGSGKANGLIDYEKFSDVPKAAKDDIELGGNTQDKKSTIYNRSGAANYSSGQSPLYGNKSVYKKKEVSTSNFKRTTRYDVNVAIDAMNAKVKEIKAKVYEPPKLKKIPADTKKMAAEDVGTNGFDDYSYLCG